MARARPCDQSMKKSSHSCIRSRLNGARMHTVAAWASLPPSDAVTPITGQPTTFKALATRTMFSEFPLPEYSTTQSFDLSFFLETGPIIDSPNPRSLPYAVIALGSFTASASIFPSFAQSCAAFREAAHCFFVLRFRYPRYSFASLDIVF